jgi:NDP-sugar pyrophosphorylase family protein
VKAVVLAGGAGTRLHPYTRVLPKPLLPIGDRPILEIIVAQLREAGIEEIVMATGYLSGLIEAFFGDGSVHGIPITYAREDRALGTAGPLTGIDGLDDSFLLMNGDVLTDPLYEPLLATHRSAGALATVATHPQEVEIDYGVVELGQAVDGTRRISAIREKPRHRYQVSMGIYAFEPRVLDYVDRERRMDFPELIERLLEDGQLVASYEHHGYWADIGQVHDLEAAVQEFERDAERFMRGGRANLRVPKVGLRRL